MYANPSPAAKGFTRRRPGRLTRPGPRPGRSAGKWRRKGLERLISRPEMVVAPKRQTPKI